MKKSRIVEASAVSLRVFGGLLLAISLLTGLLLPLMSLVIGKDMDFWAAVGIVVFLPVIFFIYPLLALSRLQLLPALIVYGGLIGGIALIRLSGTLIGEGGD